MNRAQIRSRQLLSAGHSAGYVLARVLGPSLVFLSLACGAATSPEEPEPLLVTLSPNTGSTRGGTPLEISGASLLSWVTIDGVRVQGTLGWDPPVLRVTTPPHAAGTVELLVSSSAGRAARLVYTFARPDFFDFNGRWGGVDGGTHRWIEFNIKDNRLASLSCSWETDETWTFTPPLTVTDGEFSYAGPEGDLSGHIVSATRATGYMRFDPCQDFYAPWYASRH